MNLVEVELESAGSKGGDLRVKWSGCCFVLDKEEEGRETMIMMIVIEEGIYIYMCV